ncbi:alpha/beta hydrolase [Geodermatophilus sp. URMC 62]|uniref:alpha/beta hydrolase n=1 Tax=Geodermatophilus sp. URMC 62 TaxID=3423414 RepID=UPI00406C6487
MTSTSELPDEVLAELRRIGRTFTPESIDAVRQLLAPLHEARAFRAPRVDRDLTYGRDARHRLDVHTTDDGPPGRPVLLFVHGGGFVGGDKTDPVLPYYDHLGGWAVRHGMVAVTMTYRLAPAHQWPAAAEDIAAALAWTREHVADLGGDPDRIVLAGQSAGAAHVASFLAGHGGSGAETLAGAVLLSGIYDPPTAEHNVMLEAYYGSDPAAFAGRSALAALARSDLPMLFGVAELDLPDFHHQAAVLLDAVRQERGVLPLFVTVPDHTHLSEILALGLDEDAFGAVFARFVHGATTSRRSAPA